MRPRLRMPAQLRDEAQIEARRVHKPINGRCALIREHHDQVELLGSTSDGAHAGLRAVGDAQRAHSNFVSTPLIPLVPFMLLTSKNLLWSTTNTSVAEMPPRPLIPTPVRGLRALRLVLGSDGEIQRGPAVGLTRTPTLCPCHTGVPHDKRKHGGSGRLRTIRWTAWETAGGGLRPAALPYVNGLF